MNEFMTVLKLTDDEKKEVRKELFTIELLTVLKN